MHDPFQEERLRLQGTGRMFNLEEIRIVGKVHRAEKAISWDRVYYDLPCMFEDNVTYEIGARLSRGLTATKSDCRPQRPIESDVPEGNCRGASPREFVLLL